MNPQSKTVLRTTYILIDFENVQPGSFQAVENAPIEIRIFRKERQTKVSFELAESLQSHGNHVEFIKMEGSGPNALDFHIAYHIGKMAEKDPSGYFHIVSKDKGFESLIRHLKNNQILAQRVNELSDIRPLNSAQIGSTNEKAEAIKKWLKERVGGRPGKIKALKNSINAFFMKSLSDRELEKIVSLLKSKKIVKINDQKISNHI